MGTNTDPFYLLTDVNMEVRRHGKKLRHSYRWLCRRMQSERWNEQAGQVEKAALLVSHPSQPTRRSDIQPEEVTVEVKGRADDETRRLEQLKTVCVFPALLCTSYSRTETWRGRASRPHQLLVGN